MEPERTLPHGVAVEPPTAHAAPDIATVVAEPRPAAYETAPAIAADIPRSLEAPVEAVAAPIPVAEPVSSISSPAREPATPQVFALWERLREFTPRRRTPSETPIPLGPDQPANGAASEGPGNRFKLLAATITLAACLGAAAGAAGFAGAARLLASADPAGSGTLQRGDIAAETKALKDSIAHVRASIKTLSDSVASLKAGIDASGKANTAAIAKLNEQVMKLQDGFDRSDKAKDPRAAKPAETAAHRAASADVTGSIPAPAPRPVETAPGPRPLGVVPGWTLRRVYGGIALVDGRYGEVEVMAGDQVRGLGRIEEIRRQDGRWVVVTERGLIVSR